MDPLARLPIMEGWGVVPAWAGNPGDSETPPCHLGFPFGGGLINSSTRMLSDLDGRDVAVGVLAMSDRHI